MQKKTTPSIHGLSELPYTSYPTLSFPSFFYKIKNRIDHSRSIILVGLQLHVMQRVQEDHLMQLIQIFNKECLRIKVHLIEPYLIYGEFKIDMGENFQQIQELIELQTKLFQLLRNVHSFFGQFIRQFLNESFLFSTQFDSARFIQKFMEIVVEKTKQREKSIFERRKR